MVPVAVQEVLGADYTLAVNLGQEIYSTPVEGIPQIIGRTLNILTYETSSTDQALLADLAVYPGVSGVKLDDLSRAEEIIRTGRRAMRDKIPELEAGLQETGRKSLKAAENKAV